VLESISKAYSLTLDTEPLGNKQILEDRIAERRHLVKCFGLSVKIFSVIPT
jgi:hypothetical protein